MDDVQAKAFFDLVNLDYPGLESVRSAVQAGDYPRAKEALADYYKAREHPGWYWDEPKGVLWTPQTLTSADEVLARKFTYLAKTAQLEKKIDWAADPCQDREWAWSLNRHHFFQTLGIAYWQTHDEKYAADFSDIVTDWVLSNPVPAQVENRSHSWRTIEAGIRMWSSWPVAWYVFRSSPSFTTDARILMLKSFAEHADYLTKFPTGGNWNLMETNGLLHVGALLPEFNDAGKWRDTAVERLVRQMQVQVYPDGAQFELTTAYHNVSLWNLCQPVMLRRVADGFDFPKEYYDGLRRMQEWNAGVMRPDGQAPMVNDSDAVSQLSRLREQFLSLGADKIPELQPLLEVEPAKESVFFPYSGIFAMRSGDQPRDLYLMMDAGPFGAGHQHEDKLNLEVYAYGCSFIADPGRYSYTGAGGPFRASGAHSLILVDGMGQNRRAADRSAWIVKDPAPGNRWVSNADFDCAEGTYDDGFGPTNDKTIAHIRKVFFVKPEYWIVCDVLKGGGEHKFEQLWHFTPGRVRASKGLVCTVADDSANLAVIRSDGADVRTVEGEDTPILGYYSSAYNKRSPAPTAVFTNTCTAPTAFETVLYPSPAGKTVTPTVEPVTCLVDGKRPASGRVSAISIKLPDREDVFVMCHDPADFGKVKRFLSFEFTGEAVWIRTNAEGKVIKHLTLGDGKLTDN